MVSISIKKMIGHGTADALFIPSLYTSDANFLLTPCVYTCDILALMEYFTLCLTWL